MFPDSFLEELRDRCRIEDIVSQYVEMKRTGTNMVGLCPFHREKTPSFTVSTDKQIFHCFGCSQGGNVFSFIMKIENMDFVEAVTFLASKVGMTVPQDDGNKDFTVKRQKIYDINREAARFFHATLNSEKGKAALAYLRNRKLSDATIIKFGLGFALDEWDGLINHLASFGYTKGELIDSGLAVKNKTGGIYDRFRNRVIFPIIDVRGEVIGFGGRVMDDSLPKYLNSPDTAAFNKSRNLFSLNNAKSQNNGRLILAEGYMDVIALYQAGFKNSVASLGTSLTFDQARLMARYAKEVVISYDSDDAGKAASQRAIDILNEAGLSVKVLKIEGAKDPDEYIKKNGAERFKQMLDICDNYIEYRFFELSIKYDLNDIRQKVLFFSEIAKVLADIENAVERELYMTKVSRTYEMPKDALEHEIKKLLTKKSAGFAKQRKRVDLEKLKPHKLIREESPNQTRGLKAEQAVIHMIYSDPTLCNDLASKLSASDFSNELNGRIFSFFCERAQDGKTIEIAVMNKYFDDPEVSYIASIITANDLFEDTGQALIDLTDTIKSEHLKKDALKGGQEDMKEMIAWYKQMADKKK